MVAKIDLVYEKQTIGGMYEGSCTLAYVTPPHIPPIIPALFRIFTPAYHSKFYARKIAAGLVTALYRFHHIGKYHTLDVTTASEILTSLIAYILYPTFFYKL